jgi:glutamate-1-semialdehyde 2,1-aminomutase
MCYGVLLLGHRPPHIIEALTNQLQHPIHYGSPFPEEVGWGEKFIGCVPCADRVVLCNTGLRVDFTDRMSTLSGA